MSENVAPTEPLATPADGPAGAEPPASRWSSVPSAVWRFLPHSWKDLLAISIAVVSLAISLNTSQGQTQRDLRQQLTDTLDRYLQIQAQQINIFQDIQNNPDNLQQREFSRQVYNTFDLQNTALLSQAAELVNKIQDEVEWADYASLAVGFASTGDLASAERYYRAAIDSAAVAGEYATGRTRNMYAAFLFTQPNRLDDARQQYEQIQQLIREMAVDEELRRSYRVNQYLYWARSEASVGKLDETDAVLANACEVANSSELPLNRDTMKAGINEIWALAHQYPFIQAGQAGGGLFCP